MKLLTFFLTTFIFCNAFGQSETDQWALNLSSHFAFNAINNRSYVDNDQTLYNDVYKTSTGFYTFQPSLRKYKGRYYTEFGIRNAGWSDETIWNNVNYNFNNTNNPYTVRQVSGNITAFFSKSVRLIGAKNGIYLGGDVFLNTLFQRSDFWDNGVDNQTHNFSATTLKVGSSIIPSYNYNLGKKMYLDFSIVIPLLTHSTKFQSFADSDTFNTHSIISNFSFSNTWSPQFGIGIKL